MMSLGLARIIAVVALTFGVVASPAPAKAAAGDRTSYPIRGMVNNGPCTPAAAGPIVTGSDGNLWLVDRLCRAIQRLSPTGTSTHFTLPGGFNSKPMDITAGPDGNLWYTTDVAGSGLGRPDTTRVGRLTPSGAITEFTIEPGIQRSARIAAGPLDSLWVTVRANVILRVGTDGQITELPVPGHKPYGITAGPDGNLWFTDDDDHSIIGRMTPQGEVTTYPIPTAGGYPLGITAGPGRDVWFTEAVGGKIAKISPEGVVSEYSAPGVTERPTSITLGPDGNLWFTGDNVGRVSPNGEITDFGPSRAGYWGAWITAGPDTAVWYAKADEVIRIDTGAPLPVIPDSTVPVLLPVAGALALALSSIAMRGRRGLRHPEDLA